MNDPHNIGAEQSVIGAILLQPRLFEDVNLRPEDFYTESHRLLWATISKMLIGRHEVDVITVANAMPQADLERVGGLAYIGELANNAVAANVKTYARIIREKSLTRALMAAAVEIREIAEYADMPIAERIEQAQRLLSNIDNPTEGQLVSMPEGLRGVISAIERRREGEEQGLMTGFLDLDKATHGLRPGHLIYIAGRPGMGKTAIAMNIATNVAKASKRVLVVSMEMGVSELLERVIASTAKIRMDAIQSGELDDDELNGLVATTSRLIEQHIELIDKGGMSLNEVVSAARNAKRKMHGLDLIVIDYLQLMSGSGDNRNGQVEQISRGLKALAKELACPIICLSQLSRKCMDRTDKRPQMSDLRDSGSIEQDADLVLMMYRDEEYNPGENVGLAEMIVAKNRHGRTPRIALTWAGEFCRFDNHYGPLPALERGKPKAQKHLSSF